MADTCSNSVDTGFVALGYVKVALLGVVQGITELLPISSTAHMRIVPALFGWQDPGSAFSAIMQLAALAAVISYFWVDVRAVAAGSIGAVVRGRWGSEEFRLAIGIVLATIPIVVAGVALSSVLNSCAPPSRSPASGSFGCCSIPDCRPMPGRSWPWVWWSAVARHSLRSGD